MMQRFCWLLMLMVIVPAAHAATARAFLDRNQVSLGDTVTLNITGDAALDNPDLSPLRGDFQVLGTSRSSNVSIDNGKVTRTSQLGIALKPLHVGTLTIPALSVGGVHTNPLTLRVVAAPSGGQGKVGEAAFMEASVLSNAPYVGQQTVYTVRLFIQPGVQNRSLAPPQADGARLIQLDRAHQYMARRNGYAYQVIERSWALIPLRSGAITVRGPSFSGQDLGATNLNAIMRDPNALLNNPNAMLNGPFTGFGTPVHASAPAVNIDARAVPATAGKPWLPARSVQLKLTGLPTNGEVHAGEPVTITLQVSAQGLPADALPEPALPAIVGARVYPDQTKDATDASGEWLQSSRTRSFAIMPNHDGSLTIPAITLAWWDVEHNRAEQASLPAHTLHVSGVGTGTGNGAVPQSSITASSASSSHPATVSTPDAAVASERSGSAPASRWRVLALASLVLWFAAVVAALWWWFRRRRRPADAPSLDSAAPPATSPRDAQQPVLAAARAGDAPTCEHALLAWARSIRPEMSSIGALRDALDDPAQRDALAALQRVRWKGGDAVAGCAAVADAFARGFVWRDIRRRANQPDDGLPPLYPPS